MATSSGADVDVLKAINNIEAQTDKFGVFDIVCSFGGTYGFEYVTLGQLVHPTLQEMEYADLGVSNYPEEFQRIVAQHQRHGFYLDPRALTSL